LDISAISPLQQDSHLAAQFDISAIRATARSPPPSSNPAPPLQPGEEKNSPAPPPTREEGEVVVSDGDTYLTPVTTTEENFPRLPPPATMSLKRVKAGESFSSCISTPRSVNEFKAGKNFPLSPSPASALAPRSPKEFKPGEDNLTLILDGDDDEDKSKQ
jgi:hypothetical protein